MNGLTIDKVYTESPEAGKEVYAAVQVKGDEPADWGRGWRGRGGTKGKENVLHMGSRAPHQFSALTVHLNHLGELSPAGTV